ncbi:HYC_CC_PP family protein [Cyclobacterium salsum]|uniref:HYC_CC_PP family protein n=1 Tax=Cyclobacterium salsum TaxID=2666329 RepID=UPI001390D297|nr:hypothetical protein [Cyclobacterium salsum]
MNALKNIASLFLSLLVVLSSMTFTVNLHLCMGELESVGILTDAPACDMHRKSCHAPEPDKNSKEDCCEDEQRILHGQDELSKSPVFQKTQPELVAVLSLLVSYFTANTELPLMEAMEVYIPPLLPRDIPVLIQSFLI